MRLALSAGFLEFVIIIAAVLSQNSLWVPFFENLSFSRMEEIYFSALDPETTAINFSLSWASD